MIGLSQLYMIARTLSGSSKDICKDIKSHNAFRRKFNKMFQPSKIAAAEIDKQGIRHD
jgi:hypothetical protein